MASVDPDWDFKGEYHLSAMPVYTNTYSISFSLTVVPNLWHDPLATLPSRNSNEFNRLNHSAIASHAGQLFRHAAYGMSIDGDLTVSF